METNGIELASSMVSDALAAKNQNRAQEAQMSVLRKQLDTQEQAANKLLEMMGKGQNLNVVG